MTNFPNDLDMKTDDELMSMANGKIPVNMLSGRSTTTAEDIIIQAKMILQKRQRKIHTSPWLSGSFYLSSAVVIIVLLAFLSRLISLWLLSPILIGGILFIIVIGAFQLCNDEVLKDESFIQLMVETLKRLPLLKK